MLRASPIFIVLAALCWGLSGGIGGILMGEGWNPFVVSFYRGAIGLLFVLGWFAVRPSQSGLLDRRLWLWSVLAGIGVAGNFAFYFVSIDEGSVAVAATLMYSAPVFVYLVSFALKLEKPSWLRFFGIALVTLGMVLLTGVFQNGVRNVNAIAVGAGLLSALSYATFIFGFKYASSHGSPQAILMIAFATLLMLLIWPCEFRQMMAVYRAPSWPLFIALGTFGAGVSFILYIWGLRQTSATIASIVAMVEPVTASLFGYIFLDQSLSSQQLSGMALILVTVSLLSAHSDGSVPATDWAGKD